MPESTFGPAAPESYKKVRRCAGGAVSHALLSLGVQHLWVCDPGAARLAALADYMYDPGACLGRYRMDTLWFAAE